jgi:hypothetical protein
MKESLKELVGYTIQTKDEEKGKVVDFLFDEKQWIIRYVQSDFSTMNITNKALIPKAFFNPPEKVQKILRADLDKKELDKCPDLADHLPVSRKYEEQLLRYFQIVPYWSTAYIGPVGTFFPPRPINAPMKILEERTAETILRSFQEVEGYHVRALNGKLGHIEDLIIDDEDWQIIYAVVDTSNWLPWSKKVLIALDWMERISYQRKEVEIKLKKEDIKNAFEYDPKQLLDARYEKSLYDFYSRSLVK